MKSSHCRWISVLLAACWIGIIPIFAQGNPQRACPAGILEANVYQISSPHALLCQMRLNLLMGRARHLATTFDYDGGIALVDEGLNIAPQSAALYTLRGELTLLLYEWNHALEDFDKALDLDPNYSPAYFQRGVLLYTMADREAALHDFETYLDLNADGPYQDFATQYITHIETELDTLNP